jgi:hypothetical protein
MPYTVTTAFVDQFDSMIHMLAEQKDSRLSMTCAPKSVTGDTFYVERLGSTEMQAIADRHGDSPVLEPPHSRRKGSMSDWDWGAFVDEMDEIKMLIQPTSPYVQKAMAAANRKKDDLILTALGGAAYSGHTGGTTVNNYDTGECRLVDGDGSIVTAGSDHSNTTETALTIGKLLTCKQLLDDAEIDPDLPRYFVTNPFNLNNLSNQTEVKSNLYNRDQVLVDGKLKYFLGFNFIQLPTSMFTENATDTECIECYAFVQDAVTLATGKEITTSITQEALKRMSTYVYLRMSFGATRVEGPRVVEILLDKE